MTSDTPTNTAKLRDWPHRVIRRSDTVRPLPPHTRSLADLTFEVGGRSLSVSDCMTRCRTAGVLILKGGEIALERYGMESGPGRRREGYSTTKSIVATLVGAALHDGAIGSLDDCCDLYVPRLRGSAYEGVTVRNVMRMCSGVAWDEEGDGRADTGRLELAWASRQPGTILDLACSLPRAQPQGTFFNYSTVESCRAGRGGCGRHGPDAGRLLRREDLAACRHGSQRVLDARCRRRPGGRRIWRQRMPARSRPLRPAGFGGRRGVQWPTDIAIRLARPHWLNPTARPPASAGSCPALPWDTATIGGPCRTGRPASTPALFWRPAPSASTSTSIQPSGWSLPSRVRGVSTKTPTPTPGPGRCSELPCARSERRRR